MIQRLPIKSVSLLSLSFSLPRLLGSFIRGAAGTRILQYVSLKFSKAPNPDALFSMYYLAVFFLCGRRLLLRSILSILFFPSPPAAANQGAPATAAKEEEWRRPKKKREGRHIAETTLL